MEAINDSSKLIAQAVGILKELCCQDFDDQSKLHDSIKLLEEALDKLVHTI